MDPKDRTLVEVVRGLKRTELSKKSNVSYRVLCAIEREGFTRYRESTKKKIADALNVPIELLF
jgi:DNA-binding XRE family transcriptional regulator